uniref:Uncharacterized protein n=1 Tax=Amphimedon queenslandica TaxID=400682 RepID=A0A1X7V326_AMPQE
MSEDLIAYLNCIAGLKYATDQQLECLINEWAQFTFLFKSDMITGIMSSIDSVFDKIDYLAKQLEEEEIAEESIIIEEDAAAAAAIRSFGLSMGNFAGPLKEAATVMQAKIKKKEDDLYHHLASADKDIADKVGGPCAQFIILTKINNDNGMKDSSLTVRNYLYNFMDYISRHGGVGLANVKKYTEVARLALNDANVSKICSIIDDFSLSGDHGEKKMKEALQNMAAIGMNTEYLQFARGFAYRIWIYKMKISAKVINTAAKNTGIPPKEIEVNVLENTDVIGKVMDAFTIMTSIVDAYLNVYKIVKTVERYKANVKVFADARKQYKEFYLSLYNASFEYNENLS